jgi:hypothetical protein
MCTDYEDLFDEENFPEAEPVTDLRISVVVEFEGKTFSGEIHNEESFTADLRNAIRKGMDPIDVIACLADHGAYNRPSIPETVIASRLGGY